MLEILDLTWWQLESDEPRPPLPVPSWTADNGVLRTKNESSKWAIKILWVCRGATSLSPAPTLVKTPTAVRPQWFKVSCPSACTFLIQKSRIKKKYKGSASFLYPIGRFNFPALICLSIFLSNIFSVYHITILPASSPFSISFLTGIYVLPLFPFLDAPLLPILSLPCEDAPA